MGVPLRLRSYPLNLIPVMRAQGKSLEFSELLSKQYPLFFNLKSFEMKNSLVLFSLLVLFSTHSIAQSTFSGKVLDSESGEPLVGATVRVLNSYLATSTDPSGSFQLRSKSKDQIELVISFIGYQNDTLSIKAGEIPSIELKTRSIQTEEVIISATRVNADIPSTSTNISKDDVENLNLGQDLPYMMQQSPSLVTYSDAGAGVGYTGLRIRGSDASRINVTVNGIPLNDAESHGVFWVNMPDFASSLESIQIQRGLGTSTNGAGAFGATINLESTGYEEDAYGEINNSFGSFNTRKHTVKVGSGLVNDHFVFEGRLSKIASDGYIDRASSDLQSYYLSGAYYGEKTTIKAITFGGKERTYQSWYGTPESRFNDNREGMEEHAANEGLPDYRRENLFNSGRTYNYYLYDNQVDNYNQDHYQLHFSRQFSKKLTANLSLHYTYGRGYFEEFRDDEALADYDLRPIELLSDTIRNTDLIRRRWLENDFYGFTFSTIYGSGEKLSFTLGGGFNQYVGDHFGEIIWAEYASNSFIEERYYFNDAVKNDGNVYLKTLYKFNDRFDFFTDLQLRGITYSTQGVDNDQRNIDIDQEFQFFNPKVGMNYSLKAAGKLYLFGGIGHREPNRADLTDQDPGLANEAERMINLELGYEKSSDKYMVALNLYSMTYDDQLVLTGQLNDVGSPIRQNVDNSYRRGVEIQLAYAFTKKLSLMTNATFSQNKIENFSEILYDYGSFPADVISRDLGTTDIAFSPEVIVNGELRYQAFKGFEIAWLSNYVGDQYLDNTSNEDRKLDAYLVNNLRMEYTFKTKSIKQIGIQLLVNNVLSEDYAANGYTYSYIFGETITENFYYPQAFRNYLVGLNLKF